MAGSDEFLRGASTAAFQVSGGNTDWTQWLEQNADRAEGTSDMSWSTETEPLYEALHDVADYDMPVLVTENGIADSDDRYRTEYIEGAVESVQRARDEGVPVEGYLHWSLLGNFEWDYGHWPDFGLVDVTEGYERVPRDSAQRYAELIEDDLSGSVSIGKN